MAWNTLAQSGWPLWYVVETAYKYNTRDIEDPSDYLPTKIMLGD